MRNRQSGFTMLELIIVMAIFMLVIFSASDMFVSLLTEFKQQGKIAITNIEGILGLEMMRRDIEHAGYGLPWDGITAITAYSEITAGTEPAEAVAATLNDATLSAPRAILSRDGAGWHGTDHLAIKAANVAMSNTCEKWTLLDKAGVPAPWTAATDNLKNMDNVIVISQGPTSRTLVPVAAGGFTTTFANIANFDANRSDTSIVYGIDPNTAPKMPFNRADYYVEAPASASDLPTRCAAGTGLLYKAVASQAANDAFVDPPMPVLDCVADMQVAYVRLADTNNDAVLERDITQNITALTAEEIRTQVREVRVYILAQDGQRDKSYDHPYQPMRVGETSANGGIGDVGRDFDFVADGSITDWQHYRWKLYILVAKPVNLR